MRINNVISTKILAELLRLQQWHAGDNLPLGRIFGLLHGFETAIAAERDSYGVSAETQETVERLVDQVEAGTLKCTYEDFHQSLREEDISPQDARLVLSLCLLENRLVDGVSALTTGDRPAFRDVSHALGKDTHWHGATFYVELVDTTNDPPSNKSAVYAPCIPRSGDVLWPEGGEAMVVIRVEHVVVNPAERTGRKLLVPYVYLRPLEKD